VKAWITRSLPHWPAMTAGGRVVHIAGAEKRPVCGADVCAGFRVPARVTCAACAKRFPSVAKRWAKARCMTRVPEKLFDASYEPIRAALDRFAARKGLNWGEPLAKKSRIVDLTRQQGDPT
jgi:hypothetical protein